MVQLCIRIVHNKISLLPYLHAEVNIIKCYRQLLGQSADLFKDAPFYHHARCCYRAVILCTDNPVAVSCVSSWLLHKTVTGNSTKADDNTGMLDRIVLVVQSRTDNSDITAAAVAEHFFDAVIVDHLCVIIQQQQIRSVCVPDTEIVDFGIIEVSFVIVYLNLAALFLQFFIIGKSLLFRTVVLHNNKLQIRITGFFQNRLYAAVQIIDVVFVRNDNRDQRLFIENIFRPIQAEKLAVLHRCMDSFSLIMRLNRSSSGFKRILLALRIFCCGILVASPVI